MGSEPKAERSNELELTPEERKDLEVIKQVLENDPRYREKKEAQRKRTH